MNEQDIFLAALEITDSARRADYLKQACAGNPALQRKIEELLAVYERSGEFLDVPALRQVAAGTAGAGASLEETREQRGRKRETDLSFLQPSTVPGSLGRLGHYEVQEVIGQGGYGIVFKAFDELLQRVVAIKVMAPELAATSPARKRFLREARAAAAIRHENVISIYAVEEQPIPYLVMEHIAGHTLQEKLDGTGPLDAAEVLRIGQQIARGLEAAHALGLIHRDIKPGNILLEGEPGSARAGSCRVKITDFGLARTADDASITQSGVIAGTPLYMSPEQALGQSIDPRSDLFSLGSVLYVMCSGRPPFRGSTIFAVLKRVAEDRPRPIQEIIPEAPDWLCAIIARLHAKNPADRFASAQEVADLLGRCLAELHRHGRVEGLGELAPAVPRAKSGPVLPSPLGEETLREDGSRSPARPRRHRWAAAAAVLVALCAGLGLTEATGVTNLRGTVIRLFSPDGTLVVEVDDPGVSVSIDGEEMVITGAGAKEIRLKPGQYKVLASKDGKVVSQELVTVTRNGRQVVRISKEAGPASASETRPSAGDPDRAAAEYVLSIGGDVGVNGQGDSIRAAAELPKEPFRLTRFNLYLNGRLTDAGLAPFKDCKGLTYLDLHDCGHVTDAGLAPFKDCKGLTYLDLHDCGHVTDAGLAPFKDCKDLTHLDLSSTRVTDAGLAHFKDCKDLTQLYLGGTPVTDAGLAHFKDCKNLKVLSLYGTPVTDAGLAHFKDCKDLTQLYLISTRVTDAGLAHFKDCKNLTQLDLSFTRVTDAGLAHFKDCKDLTHLNLSRTRVTDAGLAHFKDCKDLTQLDLSSTRVTDAGLAHFKDCKNLKALSLNVTRVTDAGLAHFKDWKDLTYLVLSSTPVTDAGLAHFKDCKGLTYLELRDCGQVTDAGLAHFKDCKNLTQLWLRDCGQVTDAGLAHFKDCKNLTHLDLSSTRVTDAGLAHLHGLTKLGTLQLEGTKVTAEGVAALKKALPQCQVVGGPAGN